MRATHRSGVRGIQLPTRHQRRGGPMVAAEKDYERSDEQSTNNAAHEYFFACFGVPIPPGGRSLPLPVTRRLPVTLLRAWYSGARYDLDRPTDGLQVDWSVRGSSGFFAIDLAGGTRRCAGPGRGRIDARRRARRRRRGRHRAGQPPDRVAVRLLPRRTGRPIHRPPAAGIEPCGRRRAPGECDGDARRPPDGNGPRAALPTSRRV